MAPSTVQPREIWALVRRQHGVIARRQLLAMGLGHEVIAHRTRTGRLHLLMRGVWPELGLVVETDGLRYAPGDVLDGLADGARMAEATRDLRLAG